MSAFNPYREWLGIEVAEPSYYQLLHIDPNQDISPDLVQEHTTATIQRVNQVKIKGKRRQLIKQRLLKRVRRAARCLADPNLRRQYDRECAKRREPPRKALPPRASAPATGQAEPPPQRHQDNVDPAAMLVPELVRLRTRPSRFAPYARFQERKSRAKLLSLMLVALSLLGLTYLFATQTEIGRSTVFSPTNETPPKSDEKQPVDGEYQLQSQTTPHESTLATPRAASPTVSVLESESNNLPDPHPTERLNRLRDFLTTAKRQLQAREFAEASTNLEAARQIAQTPNEKAMHGRLATLADYAKTYWDAIAESYQKLSSGDELEVDTGRIIVVEKTNAKLIIRANGKNESFTAVNLPPGIEQALAKRAFNASAGSTHVFRGAMMAVDSRYGSTQARRAWERAEANGVNLGDLKLVLTDDYTLISD